jgi:hypothetical protein
MYFEIKFKFLMANMTIPSLICLYGFDEEERTHWSNLLSSLDHCRSTITIEECTHLVIHRNVDFPPILNHCSLYNNPHFSDQYKYAEVQVNTHRCVH